MTDSERLRQSTAGQAFLGLLFPRDSMPGQRQPSARPYQTSGPMAVAMLDRVMHLVHPGVTNPLRLTEKFSISGLMTPAKPVSYKSADPDVKNGLGAPVEAG